MWFYVLSVVPYHHKLVHGNSQMILDPSPDPVSGPEGKEAKGVSKGQKRMAAIVLCIMGIVGTLMAMKR